MWALIQYDWCPCKKEASKTQTVQTEGHHVKTRQNGGHLQAKEWGSEEIKLTDTLISGFNPPELW